MNNIKLSEYLKELEGLREEARVNSGMSDALYQCMRAGREGDAPLTWDTITNFCHKKGLTTLKRSQLRFLYMEEKRKREATK